jgi:hypothetical protein
MKKILLGIMAGLMAVSCCSCLSVCDYEIDYDFASEEEEKTYFVGDNQPVTRVSFPITNVESYLYFEGEKSENGSWVVVHFTMETKNDNSYRVYYKDFMLNDTYTMRESEYSLTNIEDGEFYLVKGNTYDFYVGFDCKYAHTEVDMVFEWEMSLFYIRQWVI